MSAPATDDAARLAQFVADWQVHEREQQAQQRWMRWAATTLVCLAVSATLSSLKYATFSNRTIGRLNLSAASAAQSSSAWQDHEALRIRAYLYELHRERLDMDLEEARSRLLTETAKDMSARLDKYAALAKEHAQARDRSFTRAKAQERESDKLMKEADAAERHVNAYAFTITLFQIGVAFVSLSLITRRRWPWFIGLALQFAGALQALNATFLWVG